MSATARVIAGDCRTVLPTLAAASVQCVITSPPYFGLRDYGTAEWEGGDSACPHSGVARRCDAPGRNDKQSTQKGSSSDKVSRTCLLCGAQRVDAQLGLESLHDCLGWARSEPPCGACYVCALRTVFREVWRVLRDDGVLFLNLGDSYATGAGRVGASPGGGAQGQQWTGPVTQPNRMPMAGVKPKDLIGIPWRIALALQADGWTLRSDIVWAKPNPMPESVTDRPTKAHEYVFLLSKSARYYWDGEAVKETTKYPVSENRRPSGTYSVESGRNDGKRHRSGGFVSVSTRNIRTVWTIATDPFPDAHFAVFPPALIMPMVKAGSRPAGKQCDCDRIIASPTGVGEISDPTMKIGRAGMNRPRRIGEGTRPVTRRQQREWAQQIINSKHRVEMEQEAGIEAFAHYIRTDQTGARPPRPNLLELWLSRGWLVPTTPSCDCSYQEADIVLDPFCGAGTVGLVAKKLGRSFIGIELNPDYCAMAERRINDAALPLFEVPVAAAATQLRLLEGEP